jgi:hypothetical protein
VFELLDSDDPHVGITGAFIALEIGERVAPIADRLCSCLGHPAPVGEVRMPDAIVNSGPPYSPVTVRAIETLTTDRDQGSAARQRHSWRPVRIDFGCGAGPDGRMALGDG